MITNLNVSKKLKEMGVDQYSWLFWHGYGEPLDKCDKCGRKENFSIENREVLFNRFGAGNWIPAYDLSELVPVLKQISEIKGWGKGGTDCPTCGSMGGKADSYGWGEPEWLFHYLSICRIYATLGEEEANHYIETIL